MKTLQLTDPEYDLDPQESSSFTYIIASTPRCGSSYLSKHLWETGILGCPAEYFNFNKLLFRLTARFGVETPIDYLKALKRVRTTPNGVFGVKVHFDHLQFLSISGLLQQLSPVKFVRLIRNEPVSEAVSLSRALQTGAWHSQISEADKPAVYSVSHINWCVQHLRLQKQGWDQFFESHKLPHMIVKYETLVADTPAVIAAITQNLGFPATPKLTVSLPEMKKQSNSLNQEWIERYEQDPQRVQI